MPKKIITSLTVLTLLGCSSTKPDNLKPKKEPNKTANITVYSGVLRTNDTCFDWASSAVRSGNKILVADTENNLIRKIENNKITTYVGNGIKENKDGQGVNASLNRPENIVIDSKKNLYVSVNYNQIYQIDSLGNAELFSGRRYRGSIDGIAGQDGEIHLVSYRFISGLAITPNNEIFVADKNSIRKIDLKGTVTTIAGNQDQGDEIGKAEDARFHQISDIALNKLQELYIVDQVNRKVKKLSQDGTVSTFIPKGIIKWPASITVNSKGIVIVFDSEVKQLLEFDQQGKLLKTIKDQLLISQDFSFQVKLKTDEKDNIILTSKDFVNCIDKNSKITQYGLKNGTSRNGDIKTASYKLPFDGVFDKNGNLFVLDKGNNLIRKISKEGLVTTFCGNGSYGKTVGKPHFTSFEYPESIAIDNANNLYVINGDWKDVKIIKIDTNGHSSIFINPKQKRIDYERLQDLAIDSKNNLYITDSKKNTIHKFDAQGNKIELDIPITFNELAGITIDNEDNLFLCDSRNNRIVKVFGNNKAQIITTNNGITLNEPENITIDKYGNLYVTDHNRTRIIKIDKNLNSSIFVHEYTIGQNKDNNFSEYNNSLKIKAFEDAIYVFDKYDNRILKLQSF
ncbi:NHL repeat-containing protein [Flavobacterium faecale]|uniref:NHL repeat-containing protein n=1 Tax=Flavobacterium faecale TaxID=1355330 RepID=UPI003AACBAD8